MPTLEDIKPGARLRGLDPAGIAEVVQVACFAADALNLVFRVEGRVGECLVYRGEETSFEFFEVVRTYAFNAGGALLRLAPEGYRIRLAHLFDSYLAVSASQIEALPHQITAVYGEMLPRQPLRFLLADDPGAGKAILLDYIKATVGFEKLGEATGTQPKSLIRMFGPRGNPQARNLFGIIGYLQKQAGVELHVRQGPR